VFLLKKEKNTAGRRKARKTPQEGSRGERKVLKRKSNFHDRIMGKGSQGGERYGNHLKEKAGQNDLPIESRGKRAVQSKEKQKRGKVRGY